MSASETTAIVVATRAPYPPVGGAEKRTLRLLEAMQRAGAAPRLLVTEPADPGALQALRERGVGTETVAAPPPSPRDRLSQHLHRRPSPYLAPVTERLAALVAELRPRFVQFEHTQNAYYFAAAAHTPVVLSLHNVDSRLLGTLARSAPMSLRRLRLENRRHAMRITERRAAAEAAAVLCVSDEDCAELQRWARRTVLAPNGVDEEFFHVPQELPPDDIVLFVGKYDYEPNALGIERFLREGGWQRVLARRPGARLRLVGGGMAPRLAELAARTRGVELAGRVPDVAAELAAATASVVPIWHGGGTRLKVLEALAAARPVVGTALGVSGIGLEAGQDGLVSDSPAGLADATSRVLEDRELAGRLAVAGRRLASRFRWPLATAPAEDLYRELLGERAS